MDIRKQSVEELRNYKDELTKLGNFWKRIRDNATTESRKKLAQEYLDEINSRGKKVAEQIQLKTKKA